MRKTSLQKMNRKKEEQKDIHERASQSLPRGQFLHRDAEFVQYALYGRRDDPRLWITMTGLGATKRAAGPFEPHDAVRALRLANLSIPNGCELGPWQDGLGFFQVGPLPGPAHEWIPVQPARLEPSVTPYQGEDIVGEAKRTCCAPPTAPPKVHWSEKSGGDPVPDELALALQAIYARHPALRNARIGSLLRTWNAHPKGSLVWAETGALERGFFVADSFCEAAA